MKTQRVIYITVALGIAVASIAALTTSRRTDQELRYVEDVHDSNSKMASQAEGKFTDPRYLVGFNQQVFVGKVIRKVGVEESPLTNSRYTHFDVKVVYNIKGNLKNDVVISQRDQDQMVQVGSTYIFSAIYSHSTGWYTFGAKEAFQLLSSDETLRDDELRAMAERDPRVVTLQEAYPHEILSGWQRGGGPKYNTYDSRCLDASDELIDDTVQAEREKQGLTKAECVTPLASEVQPLPETATARTPVPTPAPAITANPPPPPPSVPQF